MILDIPLNGGLRTFADSEQIGNDGCTVLKNIDIHIPGKFQTRTIFGDKATISDNVKAITRWVAPDGTTYWVIRTDATLHLTTNPASLGTDYSGSSTGLEIANYGDYLRFFGDLTKRPQTLHYYSSTRKHFWSMDSSTFSAGFSISEGIPAIDSRFNFSVTSEPSSVSTTSYPFGNLDLQNKVYYYKVAPVFDGVQEGLLSEILMDSSEISSTNDSTGVIQSILSFKDVDSTFDNRLSGLNFYRATESGGPYYKILSASCLGDSDPSLTKITDGDIGLDVYAPDADSVTTGYKYFGNEANADTIASVSGNIITLGATIDSTKGKFGQYGYFVIPGTSNANIPIITNMATSETNYVAPGSWENEVQGSGSGFTLVNSTNTDNTYYNVTRLQPAESGSVTSWLYDDITTVASQQYDIHLVYKTDSSNPLGAPFNVKATTNGNFENTDDTGLLGAYTQLPNTDEWTHVTHTFTATSTATEIGFQNAHTSATGHFYFTHFIVVKRDSSTSQIKASPVYGGLDTLVSSSLALDRTDGKKGNMAYLYQTPGTYSSRTFSAVKANTDKAVQFTSELGFTDTAVEMHLDKNYLWRQSSSTKYDIVFNDHALNDGISPALEAVSDISVNHKYSQFLDGRNYVANVKFPNANNETHNNWVIYSELNQPDVLPVSNYIEIQDSQGGEILGLSRMLGDLVIFMERGIYRLHTPSTDPGSWSLIESEENIGCVAPDSIIEVEGVLYFAGKDHIYGLDANFQAVPITKNIQDVWQGTSSQESTKITYDPKLKRLLCQFGGSNTSAYLFHLGTGEWTKWEYGNTLVVKADHIVIDEDLNINLIKDDSSSLMFDDNITSYTLNECENGIGTERQTGWINLTKGDLTSLIRRLNLKYSAENIQSGLDVVLDIYANGDTTSAIWSKTISIDDASNKLQSFRVSRRANSILIKISSSPLINSSTSNNERLLIQKIEVEVD